MQTPAADEMQRSRSRYGDDDLPHQHHRSSVSRDVVIRASRVFDPQEESERLKLYEAFNDLQALAKKFDKPFEAPAILVLGHQTDGKSALVEALVGFQFNTVGGGTTTRRPVVLQMQYNPACLQPQCSCILDDATEQVMSLQELQAYINAANARLEEQQQFSPKEILVNIQYKHSPNLCIIDTPGLISAAPGKAHASMQAASRAIETLVRAKAEVPSLILLCLEDVNDWTHATTRRLVHQADPGLSRSVLVSTKLDARIATFSRPADVEAFLHPTSLGDTMLGGAPFFTSVPAGRVGDDADAVHPGNQEFRAALSGREAQDVAELESKLQRRLDASELAHIGVSSLRSFLEGLLRERYLQQVPAVLSALELERIAVSARQADIRAHAQALNQSDLKERGRRLTEDFLLQLNRLLHGNACPPVDKFGQTLADEHEHAGCFTLPSGELLPVPDTVPNAVMRLYGGAQFHRTMAEFRVAVGQMSCPELSREEVANACGLEDAHDGANYLRAACIIAVAKARAIFEPFLHQLGARLSHVLRQMMPATMYMLREASPGTAAPSSPSDTDAALVRVVGERFNSFIEEDLLSTTRYVTWSLHTKGSRSLHGMLSKMVVKPQEGAAAAKPSGKDKDKGAREGELSPTFLANLLEELLFSRQITSTSEELVSALVAQMFEGVRDYVVQSAELKFLSFFLMPVVDTFPQRLRSHMESLYEQDLDAVFNTSQTRTQLEARRLSLDAELIQVERLLAKFVGVQNMLQRQPGTLRGAVERQSGTDQLGLRGSPLKHVGGPSRPKAGLLGRPPSDADTVRDASIKVAAQAASARMGLLTGPSVTPPVRPA